MKKLLQVCLVTGVLTLFYVAAVGWSLGTVLSCLLTAATLVIAIDGIRLTKRVERIAILAWLYWGLSYVSNLVEALYFHVIPLVDARRSVVMGFGLAVLVACILEALMPARGLGTAQVQVRIALRLWWRIPLLAVLFFVLYLAAGAAIYPWVASFYRNKPLPALGPLFVLQFCRGLFDIACIFPLLYRWNQSRRRAAWFSVCVFTVLCGWGPLLLPNRFMPGPIRLAHGAEMGASGIAFGIVVVMLLLKPRDRRTADNAEAGSDNLHIAAV
jgi:hypothetical protein